MNRHLRFLIISAVFMFVFFLCGAELFAQSGVIRLRRNVTNYTGFLFNHENRAADFSSVDLEWSQVTMGRNVFHTLKMTFNWRNNRTGSLTLYGGTGTLGQSIIWYPHSAYGDYLMEGDFLWPLANNGRPYSLPEIVWINGAGNGRVNSIVFIIAGPDGNPADVFVNIDLDRSFFP